MFIVHLISDVTVQRMIDQDAWLHKLCCT